jgi:glycerol-3-phosphate dehydrogenase
MSDIFDVIIIGAGIAGAAVARELSQYKVSIGVLEKEADVSFGASKGTHGLIHCGGFAGRKTPLQRRGEILGNLKMSQLCAELDVEFKRVGKLLVAFNKEEESILEEIEIGAKRNGVIDAELIRDKERIKEMEPEISDDIIAVLHTPITAVVDPWSLIIALFENAQENGVELHVNTEVLNIERTRDGFIISTSQGEIKSGYIVNAAGLYADKIARMVGDNSFKVTGSRQQRMVMDKNCRGMIRHLVRGLKNRRPFGDFIFPTVDGNVLVGCKVDAIEDKEDLRTTREGMEEWIIPQYQRMIPGIKPKDVIKPFAGYIPSTGGDYHVKPAPDEERFINMVLGGSGFTSSPAMAEYLVEEILPEVGLKLEENEGFNPYRKSIPRIVELSNEERAKLIAQDPRYGHIVCRCETVSEGEIVEAIKRGATTRDGIKFRTRAGMGRCQGGFCGPRVLKILSRELKIPVNKITKKGNDSREVLFKTKELLEVDAK